MFSEVGKAAILIFIAEMGDKTQILAMAFAVQFAIRQVLLGVALGSFLNHGLAVIIGAYLAHLIPLETIRLGSAFLFLGFGLWTLWTEEDEEESVNKRLAHPVLVVALAFFLGELGDKTQLTAIALASGAQFPGAILAGTVLGMVLTSFVAIFVGIKLGEKIPELALKLISSFVFIGFGLFHLFQTVPNHYLTPINVTVFMAVLLTLIFILTIPPLKQKRLTKGTSSSGQLRRVAGTLQALDQALSNLCLQEKTCRGAHCPVGYCKKIVKQELAGIPTNSGRYRVVEPYISGRQKFDSEKIDEVLKLVEKSNLSAESVEQIKENLLKLSS